MDAQAEPSALRLSAHTNVDAADPATTCAPVEVVSCVPARVPLPGVQEKPARTPFVPQETRAHTSGLWDAMNASVTSLQLSGSGSATTSDAHAVLGGAYP
jgi:hypothetical protein